MLSTNMVLISLAYMVGIGFILIFNEVNFRIFRIKSEYARKAAHVVATLATIPFPYLFSSHWYVLGLAILFFLLLYFTHGSQRLNSIHGVHRKTYGSYLLVLAIYLTFLIYTYIGDPVFYVLPISILAICDPVAAIAGMSMRKYNLKLTLTWHQSEKTLIGSMAFFVSSILISIGILYGYQIDNLSSIVRISVVVGLISTLAELCSWRGSDNVTIPISVQLILLMMI